MGSAARLLDEGRYEDAARMADELGRERLAQGDTAAAEILGVAHELCLSCRDHRTAVDAHRNAARTARDLERRLRGRLEAVLALATRDAAEPPAPVRPTVVEPEQPPARPAREGPLLTVHCLGTFGVYRDGQKLGPWPNRRAKGVFKFLLAQRARPVPKDVLMELFWPDASVDAARNNLNVAVYALRRFLRDGDDGVAYVLFQEDCYLLHPDLDLWVDAEEFDRLVATARRLDAAGDPGAVSAWRAAEALYEGALFEDDPYEAWMLPLRRERQDRYVAVLARLQAHHAQAGDHAAGLEVCRKILGVEPWREDAHRELMLGYARQGQHHLALRQYHDCRTALRDVGAQPGAATVECHEAIAGAAPGVGVGAASAGEPAPV